MSLWGMSCSVAGSWMPFKDPGSSTDFTMYYISVCDTRTNRNYQVQKRYSDFHALYLKIYSSLVQAFTKGMQNLFPDNRVTTWFSGENDQLRNSRREYLDGWLREVCLNAMLMLNLDARNSIYDFMQVDSHFQGAAIYGR